MGAKQNSPVCETETCSQFQVPEVLTLETLLRTQLLGNHVLPRMKKLKRRTRVCQRRESNPCSSISDQLQAEQR
jgi:hypothetical protein